jgi:hypothetical protein
MPGPSEVAESLRYTHFLLCETLAEMEPEEIESVQLKGDTTTPGQTAKMIMAELAVGDERTLRHLQAVVAGMPRPELRPEAQARVQEIAKRPWVEVDAAAHAARQALHEWVGNLAPTHLSLVERDSALSVAQQLQARADWVRAQRRKVQAYCGSLARWGRGGLRTMIVEQHNHFMEGMAGLTEATMLANAVCGAWTIRDVYAHVLAWNEYCVRLLRGWPEADAATIAEWQWQVGDTMAAYNDRLLAARTHLTMIEIADGLTTEYRRMMRVFDKASDDKLTSEGLTWGGPGVMANFFYEIFVHEAEHAAQIWAFRAGVAGEEATLNRSDDS